jgi:hypothetical protein
LVSSFAVTSLILVTPGQLIHQYKGWLHVLAEDQSSKLGLSVAGWLNSLFQFVPDKKLLLGAGAVIFMLPYLRFKMYTNYLFKIMGSSGYVDMGGDL